MMVPPPPLLLLVLLAPCAVSACATDEDCSLNGQCSTAGACVCHAPWSGADCGLLDFLPAPTFGAYGYLSGADNVTSWGGNAGPDEAGLWHGFFTEISGKGCGLGQWRTHSTVVHAIAQRPEGPYVRRQLALPHEAHNPQMLHWNSSHWYIFHIGDATANSPPPSCKRGVGPLPAHPMPPTQHPIHVSATGPDGPFTPVAVVGPPDDGESGMGNCNNPSPFLHPNGTLYLACTWSMRRADRPEGPWSASWSTAPKNAVGRRWLNRYWEDCFLWVDRAGHWHQLAHTYVNAPYPAQSISGHGFSRNGIDWTWSNTEPYSSEVAHADGSNKTFSTMERPKLLFADLADPLRPTHLLNGASPVWDTSQSNPCGACGKEPEDMGACVKCKVTPDRDWTYTVVRPLSPRDGL